LGQGWTNRLRPLAKARFWVNFNTGTVDWMRDANCAIEGLVFNNTYIDVVSIDDYGQTFATDVLPYYETLMAQSPKPDQQLALVPGIFSSPGNQLPFLQGNSGYFAQANLMNQTCNLPLGPRGVTGFADGCPVWIVLGWRATNDSGFVGMLDPASAPIKSYWEAELGVALAPALAKQLTPAQILAPLYPLLLK
jgi:hypothetical protein